MYKAVRPYGSQSLPVEQDENGALLVSVKDGFEQDENGALLVSVKDGFEQDADGALLVTVKGGYNEISDPKDPITVIYPSPASFSKYGATVAEEGVFTTDSDV